MEPDRILFSGNGRQGIAAALSAVAGIGDRIGVEALTYPFTLLLLRRLGLEVVPLAVDDEGIRPEAITAAHAARPLKAVYVQPAVHNPLGMTMGLHRRRALAEVLDRLDLVAVEDGVYAFLDGDAPLPLAALAPGRTIFVDSLSKRIAPGLTLGFVVPPTALVEPVAAAMRSGGWTAQGFALEVSLRWIRDGSVGTLEDRKRRGAVARQVLVRRLLPEQVISGSGNAYHLWLTLPLPWRADVFVAQAARQGVAVTPASAFAAMPGHAPEAVRVALAGPSEDELATGLSRLHRLLTAGPNEPVCD